MKLKLIRTLFRNDGVFGHLEDDSATQIAVTLEHAYNSLPKLQSGTYTCKRGIHKLADLIPFETFEIENVTGHTDILFHAGNYNRDSQGCVLLGRRIVMNPDTPTELMITSSKNTFNKFLDILKGLNEFILVVEDK